MLLFEDKLWSCKKDVRSNKQTLRASQAEDKLPVSANVITLNLNNLFIKSSI